MLILNSRAVSCFKCDRLSHPDWGRLGVVRAASVDNRWQGPAVLHSTLVFKISIILCSILSSTTSVIAMDGLDLVENNSCTSFLTIVRFVQRKTNGSAYLTSI